MRKGDIYAGGLALNFFDSRDFEDPLSDEIEENDNIRMRNILRILMSGWNERITELLSFSILNAIFIKRNHQLTKAMRHGYQQGFHHIFSQLEGKTLNQLQLNQAQLYISNCLSFLPFADITPYESFIIPQYLDGKWQMVDYKVTPIELTPTSGFKKLFLAEQDRVFAYGLEPISHAHAEPHLIFMGTTYPAGQGFASMVHTDFEAFETAGKKLYRTGYSNLTHWLDKQYPQKTHVCGTSLGGSLSLLLAIDQGHKLSRVDALNPAGLYHPWRKSRYDHWEGIANKPEVYIQKQEDDPVSRYGIWKPDWHILRVIPPADKRGPNQFASHALNYAGFADTQFIGVDTNEDNEERRSRNFWQYTFLRSMAYYGVMLPYRYLVLPLLRYIVHNKLQFILMFSFIGLLISYPAILVAVSASIAVNTLLVAAVASNLLIDLIRFINDCFNSKNDSHLSKLLNQFTTKPILQGVGVAVILTLAITASSFPAFIPLLILAVAATPLTSAILRGITTAALTFFGYNRSKTSPLHHPTLARNESLDIYSNTIEATFSYKELGQYYRAQRCVLKNKPFLPNEESDHFKFYKSTDQTKREILENSLDPKTQNISVTITATKAKTHDIRQTLQLINQFGFHREDQLRSALQQHREEYTAGKPLRSC